MKPIPEEKMLPEKLLESEMQLDQIVNKYSEYPQIEQLLQKPGTIDKINRIISVMRKTLVKRKSFNSRTTSIRVSFEGIFRSEGYVSKAHMLAAYEVLGIEMRNTNNFYFEAKVSWRSGLKGSMFLNWPKDYTVEDVLARAFR